MKIVLKTCLSLFAVLSLVACGDSSNNAKPDTLLCSIKRENPLIMESSYNGVVSTVKLEFSDGRLIQTVKSTNVLVINENCKELSEDSDYGDVHCEDGLVRAISKDEMTESRFEEIKDTFREACEKADDTKIKDREDLDSLEDMLDSLENTLSSSSIVEDPPEEEDPEFFCEASLRGESAIMKLTSNGVTYRHEATVDKGKVIINSTATSFNKMLVAGICSMQQGSGAAKETVCTDNRVSYKTELDIHVSSIDDVLAMFQQSCDEKEQQYNGGTESSSSDNGFGSSSSFRSSSSAVAYSFKEDLETFVDSRDGEVYTQVQIGTQLWMGQNLRYADSSAKGSLNLKGAMWCLDNEPENCEVAGGLYLWHAAMDVPQEDCGHGKTCGITKFPHRGICPEDWHMPTNEEWEELREYIGGESGNGAYKGYELMAKSESGFGTDEYGFGAVPTGEYDYRDGYTHQFQSRNNAHFWTATEPDPNGAWNWYISGSDFTYHGFDKNMGYAVRCIHD